MLVAISLFLICVFWLSLVRISRIQRLKAIGYTSKEASHLSSSRRGYQLATRSGSKLHVHFANHRDYRDEVIEIAISQGFDLTQAKLGADLLSRELKERIVLDDPSLFSRLFKKDQSCL